MKLAAKILSALAIMIFLASNVEIVHAKATFTPPRLRQPFPSAFKTPRKDSPSRMPVLPTPRYQPSKPKLSRDNRGRGVPRAPQR